MKPNIQRAGRIARATTGTLCILAGGALWWLAWPETLLYRMSLTVFAVAVGGFQIYEAKKSWCVMRAMGCKTPM